MFDLVLSGSVSVGRLDASVGVLPHPRAIRVENVLLPTRVFDCFYSVFLNSLDRSIGEDGLLLAIGKDALNRAVWEYDLFGSVRVVLFYLLVGKLEYL